MPYISKIDIRKNLEFEICFSEPVHLIDSLSMMDFQFQVEGPMKYKYEIKLNPPPNNG